MKTFILLILLLGLISAASRFPRKNLGGPPSSFNTHKIPDVLSGAVDERSAWWNSELKRDDDGYLYEEIELPVDSNNFGISFYSPKNVWNLNLAAPNGDKIDLEKFLYEVDYPIADDGSVTVPASVFLFNEQPTGDYKLNIKSTSTFDADEKSWPRVNLLLFNDSPLRVHTSINTYQLETGSKIGLHARVTEDEDYILGLTSPKPLANVVDDAVMEVLFPSGTEVDVEMHDDGMGIDLVANDGIFSAEIVASEAGEYLFTGFLEGELADGTPFVRSTEHLVRVIDDHNQFTGVATATKGKNANRLELLIEVTQQTETTYSAYAEVWGTSGGKPVPAGWIGGLVETEQVDGKNVLRMDFDLNWANNAGVSAPFTLRNAYIRCASAEAVVSTIDTIKVQMESDVHSHVQSHLEFLGKRGPVEPTEEMLFGVRPAHIIANSSANAGAVVLLHGYCSATNPWAPNDKDFENAYYFLNPSANIPNEQFAQQVMSFCEDRGINSYSLVGHSQGGMVTAHILNYYWSGMDTTGTGRKGQSVGTPYQGSTAAGSAANLGKLFGIACGSNFDLTTDGSKLWMTGISQETRANIHYYTTTYKQGKLFGDWCNLAINMLLQWPNDGTTELKFAALPGANNLGNTEKWCHTTGMGYPPQYDDSKRNQEINRQAAR